jgi:cytochrome c5
MKILKTLLIISSAAIGFSAFSKDKKKETYEFPNAMAQPVRVEYAKLCEKGKILFEISCGKCHSKIVKGKLVIPNFTTEQLGAYSIRVANAQHEDNVSESTVSAEDLTLITTYLTYRKKD